jgi:hypothetical protein
MAGVGDRRLGGVIIRRRGALAVAPAADCEPPKEGLWEECEYERGGVLADG